CGAPLDLAVDGLRVDSLADVLRGPDPDDAGKAELDIDLGDDAHRRADVGDVGAVAADLAGLGIERSRRAVVVDALDVDFLARAKPATAARELVPGGAGRELDGAGCHPGHPRGRGRA